MKFIRNFKFIVASFGLLILLTSATPLAKSKPSSEKVKIAADALEVAAKDGKVTYQELKVIATDLKGKKLSLKERIALRVFGKKISSKVTSAPYAGGGKSQLIALLLCGFLGGLGIHRFYLGYTWQGIVQLLTLGGCGIWALIDFIRIITGGLQPKDGEYETTL
jgi:hypothetical protein